MSTSLANPGMALAALCVVMVVCAALVYYFTRLGATLTVPRAAIRGALQLAAVSLILAAALAHLWSSFLVLLVMFAAAAATSARRANAGLSASWPPSARSTRWASAGAK